MRLNIISFTNALYTKVSQIFWDPLHREQGYPETNDQFMKVVIITNPWTTARPERMFMLLFEPKGIFFQKQLSWTNRLLVSPARSERWKDFLNEESCWWTKYNSFVSPEKVLHDWKHYFRTRCNPRGRWGFGLIPATEIIVGTNVWLRVPPAGVTGGSHFWHHFGTHTW